MEHITPKKKPRAEAQGKPVSWQTGLRREFMLRLSPCRVERSNQHQGVMIHSEFHRQIPALC